MGVCSERLVWDPKIARLVEVNREKWNWAFQRAGRPKTSGSEQLDQRVAGLYRSGKSYREITEATGLSHGAINARLMALRKAGVAVPKRSGLPTDKSKDGRIAELWQAGKSTDEIAADVKRSSSTVSDRIRQMRKAGVDLPYRGGGRPRRVKP
jgi:transposase